MQRKPSQATVLAHVMGSFWDGIQGSYVEHACRNVARLCLHFSSKLLHGGSTFVHKENCTHLCQQVARSCHQYVLSWLTQKTVTQNCTGSSQEVARLPILIYNI